MSVFDNTLHIVNKGQNMNPISLMPTYLKVYSPNRNPITMTEQPVLESSQGTGFFYKKGNRVYLITNRHVITERNLENQILPNACGGIPTQLKYEPSVIIDQELVEKCDITETLNLYDDDLNPIWLVHPSCRADIVAIPVPSTIKKRNGTLVDIFCVNSIEMTENMMVFVADDVFVVGYPYGLTAGINSPLAVWKRATIASEPTKNYYVGARKTILIDTTTRSGMSGSPVFCRRVGEYSSTTGDIVVDCEVHCKFIGIYSNRIDGDRRDDSFLGVVWKKEMIDEIIDGRKLEDNPPIR